MLHRLRNISFLLSAAFVFVTTGCNSTPGRQRQSPATTDTTRSQLVLLNIEEASGWVAYSGTDTTASGMENYRLLVIRQKNNDVIYDSIVPLSSNLETHGFEMEPRDPRLMNLAENVDLNIIAPMEAYKKTLPEPVTKNEVEPKAPVAAPEPEPPAEEPIAESEPEPAPPEVVSEPIEEPMPEVAEEPAASKAPPSSIPGITLTAVDDAILTLSLDDQTILKVGDRLFLRNPPGKIVIPGMEDVITAGEIGGLIQITSIDGMSATAELKSGKVPDNLYFEKAE